jgi:tRNA-specific 2-thiouridylase
MKQTNRFHSQKPIKDTKVVVAMSGGVDSSAVAALLHHEGYQVIGVTLQLYDLGVTLEKKGACCAGQDIYDAQKVANTVGFPHYVLDYESLFKDAVIEDFAESYLRGETPIPCVKCNQSVKFRDLLKVAKDLGADAKATGHYVRRISGINGAELHKAIDHTKDQSYFLFATTQEQLNFVHFPLGELTKPQTRALAERFGLEVADKPDSQDICFVPDGNYAKVIEKLRPGALDEGEIIHLNGQILGTHRGIINYTVGQRKGLGIAWEEPLYVIKLDPEKKQVIVGPVEALGSLSFRIRDINWLLPTCQQTSIEADIKVRYAQNPIPARITLDDQGGAQITLYSAERAITPGQACVAYQGDRLIGGGWIVRE